MYHEDKAQICRALVPVLQITRNLEDLTSLEYIKRGDEDEIVIATFQSGYKKTVNVSIDSGTAMITDIIRHIV